MEELYKIIKKVFSTGDISEDYKFNITLLSLLARVKDY